MKFYCPLEISRWDDDEYNEISPNEASAYESEINYFISDFNLPEEKERGLMHWYNRGNSVDQKVFSAFMSVEENHTGTNEQIKPFLRFPVRFLVLPPVDSFPYSVPFSVPPIRCPLRHPLRKSDAKAFR